MTHCRADAMLLIVLEDAFYLCLTPTFSMFAHSGYKLSFSLNLCPVFYRADKKYSLSTNIFDEKNYGDTKPREKNDLYSAQKLF